MSARALRYLLVSVAALAVAWGGFVASSILADRASAHSDPCHTQHSCPSDHATYVWYDGNGTGWLCVRPGADEYDSSFSTPITYDGLPYLCKPAGAAPPATTSSSSTSTSTTSSSTSTTTPSSTSTSTTTSTSFSSTSVSTSTFQSTTVRQTTTTRTTTISNRKSPTLAQVGKTVLLAKRSKTSGCVLGPNPDRRCSPGAYYAKLTTKVICSPSFRTSTIRHVTQSMKYAVEREYGLAAKSYGRTLEIDHIVSLELGGSNDVANLYPEKATLPGGAPGYHVKDKLENKLHDMVCDGEMTLRAAQRGIATNWQKLYAKVYGARR